MSSARNHAKRSHRSHHNISVNTGYSSRKAIICNYSKPKKNANLFTRLLFKFMNGGYSDEG